MIKTLLVDDDIEMLQGLANIVRWEDYGFSIEGRATNGYEALNLITEIRPDVLITDITMPIMNGLELIREAKKFIPNMKSVLISCHEEFNFAQEAIRLEADEYLIKHTLTEDELIRVINNLKTKIQNEREQRDKLLKANRELNINKYVIREKFYLDIMDCNILRKEELSDRAALSNISLPGHNFRMVSFFVDNIDEVLKKCPIQEYELFKFSLLNIINEIIQGKSGITSFSYNKNAFALLYCDNTADVPITQRIISVVKEIQNSVQSVLEFKPSACFSGVYSDILSLKKASGETETLRGSYFFKDSGEIVLARKEYKYSDSTALYKEFGPELKGFFSSHNRSEIVRCINKLFERIAEGEYSPAAIKSLLRRLIVDLEVTFGKYGINMESFQLKGDNFSSYKKIVEDTLEYVFKILSDARSVTSREEINRVIDYIETHLSEEINCESMANYINMNSNYFSRLFKNEIGITFSDYLINKRMEVATDLLNHSDYTIEEITTAIGIESISYFYRMYKRITGNTPGDIRNRARQF